MKKLVLAAVLVSGLAGLSACATSDASDMSTEDKLKMCEERVSRLEQMNKECLRK